MYNPYTKFHATFYPFSANNFIIIITSQVKTQ